MPHYRGWFATYHRIIVKSPIDVSGGHGRPLIVTFPSGFILAGVYTHPYIDMTIQSRLGLKHLNRYSRKFHRY